MKTLFADLGGRVTCIDHGGMYLKAELEARPKARRIDTPITSWARLTKAEQVDLTCETCNPPKYEV